MDNIFYLTIAGLLSGILGTGGGGVGVLLINQIWDDIMGFLLGFSGGVMTVIIFLELIPEAREAGSFISTLLGLLLGIVLIAFLDINFPHQHLSLELDISSENQHFYKSGILLSLGVALHNIPEGIAIGAGFIASPSIGLSLAILIGLHNIPEGMAIATALGLAGLKRLKIIIITALAGVPIGIGALIGGLMGGISELFLSIALGFAGGAMMYIVYDDLIPDCHKSTRGHTAIVGIITGIILGMILIEVLH